MAILSLLCRPDRIHDVAACPLATVEPGPEAACAACPHNVLYPGRERIGCVLSTPAAVYDRALATLERVDRGGHAELLQILDRQSRTSNEVGLGADDLRSVQRVAERWQALLGNDAETRSLVGAIVRLVEAGLGTGEPVRILS